MYVCMYLRTYVHSDQRKKGKMKEKYMADSDI